MASATRPATGDAVNSTNNSNCGLHHLVEAATALTQLVSSVPQAQAQPQTQTQTNHSNDGNANNSNSHTISDDEDNMKGICTGTGRIQIRLNANENLEDIELNFANKGVIASEHASDPRKKPNMTGEPKQFAKEITNTKNRKQAFLQTTGGGIFGQGGEYQVQQ